MGSKNRNRRKKGSSDTPLPKRAEPVREANPAPTSPVPTNPKASISALDVSTPRNNLQLPLSENVTPTDSVIATDVVPLNIVTQPHTPISPLSSKIPFAGLGKIPVLTEGELAQVRHNTYYVPPGTLSVRGLPQPVLMGSLPKGGHDVHDAVTSAVMRSLRSKQQLVRRSKFSTLS
jgi:hypothetical protein